MRLRSWSGSCRLGKTTFMSCWRLLAALLRKRITSSCSAKKYLWKIFYYQYLKSLIHPAALIQAAGVFSFQGSVPYKTLRPLNLMAMGSTTDWFSPKVWGHWWWWWWWCMPLQCRLSNQANFYRDHVFHLCGYKWSYAKARVHISKKNNDTV